MADSQSPKRDYRMPEFRLYGDIGEITKTVSAGTGINDTSPPKRTH